MVFRRTVCTLAIVGAAVAASWALAGPPAPSAARPQDRAEAPSEALPGGPLNPYTPPACSGVFSDVACPGGFAVNWIEEFYNDAITAGCGTNPLRYCPDSTVTRAQMAVFVEKAMRGTGTWSPGDLGSENTGLGGQALLNNTPYAQNDTAVGYQALYTQSYANGNVPYFGANTAVGRKALYSDQPDGGNANEDGTLNTAVGHESLYFNSTGFANTAIGEGSLDLNSQGYINVGVGSQAGSTNQTGSYNTFVGGHATGASGNLTDATAIGSYAVVDASYHVLIGDSQITQIGGQVGWSNLSDMRAKSDIRDLDLGLDFVLALRPVSFTMKQGNGRTDMGFVAQDVEALMGEDYNVLGIGGDKDRTLSLRYTDFIAPMVKAIQQQQETIVRQSREIAQRDDRIAKLEAGLGELRDQVQALVADRRGGAAGARP